MAYSAVIDNQGDDLEYQACFSLFGKSEDGKGKATK